MYSIITKNHNQNEVDHWLCVGLLSLGDAEKIAKREWENACKLTQTESGVGVISHIYDVSYGNGNELYNYVKSWTGVYFTTVKPGER